MTTFLFTAAIIAVLMLGMALGVVFAQRPLKGSCGGVGTHCACAEAKTPGACAVPAPGRPAEQATPPGRLVRLRRE